MYPNVKAYKGHPPAGTVHCVGEAARLFSFD